MTSAYLSLLRYDLAAYLRAPAAMFWTFVFPVFLLGVLILAFGRRGAPVQVTVHVLDRDGTRLSERYVDDLADGFKRASPLAARFVRDRSDFPPSTGEIRVIVPAGFESALEHGRRVAVPVESRTDGDPIVQAAQRIVTILTDVFAVRRQGRPLDPSVSIARLSAARGAKAFDYSQFIVVGVLVMALMSSGMMSTGITLASLREQGALRGLSCLPLEKLDYLLAMITTRAFVMLLASAMLLVFAKLALHVSIHLWSFAVLRSIPMVLLGSVMLLALGFLIGSRARTVASATMIANLVYFPLLLLGNLTIPLASAPAAMRAGLSVLPVAQLADGIRAVLFQEQGLSRELPVILSLVAWSVVLLLATRRLFRWNER